MKRSLVGWFAAIVGVTLAVMPASAHHSFSAEFDANKPATMQGHVTQIAWTNPNVWFYIVLKKADGTVENWGWEMGPPHGLQGRGWTRTIMKLGDEIKVDYRRAKNG